MVRLWSPRLPLTEVIWVYSSMVECRSPKPMIEVLALVDPLEYGGQAKPGI